MKIKTGYSFDDVLLIPKYSNIASRSEINLSTELGKGIVLKIPIVSANMSHVTGPHMAEKIADLGGLAILHRFYPDPIKDQIDAFYKVVFKKEEFKNHVGVSIGAKESDKKAADEFVKAGIKIICVDIAHGHSRMCFDICEYIAGKYPEVLLIAGNVATAQGTLDLCKFGADVIKVGIGPSGVCTTRRETGNGVPQLTAIEEGYKILQDNKKIISDGGCKKSADITTALCFSHAVMLGGMLAGTDEAPGDIIEMNGGKYKKYAGSSTHKPNHIEGISSLVPYKGPVENVIKTMLEGVRSGLSYQGARNLQELRNNPEFVSLSHAGFVESYVRS